MDFKNVIKCFGNTVKKHSPEILTSIGIAGMLTTTVLTVQSTIKAVEIVNSYTDKDKMTKKDVVKLTAKNYILPAVTFMSSTVCLIAALNTQNKRNAALATACKISESALLEYRDKVRDTLGEKKERTIRDQIAQDKVNEVPVSSNDVIITGNGYTLCYDELSGRYFYSDVEKIKQIVNELNRRMTVGDMYCSLNELYAELGMENTKIGDLLGWNISRGLIDVKFSATVADDGRPAIVLDYYVPPRADYQVY